MFLGAFTTARLRLRPVAADDAAAIFDGYAQDPDVTRHLIWRPHRTVADTKASLAPCLRCVPTGSGSTPSAGLTGAPSWAVSTSGARRSTGWSSATSLARPSGGRGFMTEALRAAVDGALALPGVFRVGAVCDVDNPGSARVMEKAGLAREGLLRRWTLHPNVSDEPRDCFAYGRAR